MRFVLLGLLLATIFPAFAAMGQQGDSGLIERRMSLSSAGSARLLERAKAEADARGVDVSIAIVDREGQLLSFIRLGKAASVTIDNAIAKARTAAQLGAPSKSLEDTVDGGKTSYLAIAGVVPLQGGVPVFVEGEVVGAIGCSGASADVDEAIAMAAAGALGN